MEKLNGWVVLMETVGASELAWRVGEGEETMPEIFSSLLDAWKAIAGHQIDQMGDFINEVRNFDEVDWTPTVFPAEITITENGTMIVWGEGSTELIRTTLEKWRKNL